MGWSLHVSRLRSRAHLAPPVDSLDDGAVCWSVFLGPLSKKCHEDLVA